MIVGVEEDIGGLEVAMDHAPLMGVGDRPGDLDHDAGRLLGITGTAGHLGGQGAGALDITHREKRSALVFPDFVDLDDVRVSQAGGRLGLLTEPGHVAVGGRTGRAHHFQGDGALQGDLDGLVDDAHASDSQLTDDLVATDLLARNDLDALEN